MPKRPVAAGGTTAIPEREAVADEVHHQKLAVDVSRKSRAEDGRVHPKVGVVVVRDGSVLATAYRGEERGEHAEFIALERKLGGESLQGATVFTTLEPCTTRGHPKIPCADRLVDRGVAKVVIGMLDPDSRVNSRGWRRLRVAKIAAPLFDNDLMGEIEELNREYIRSKETGDSDAVDLQFIERARARPLDEWYSAINRIYWKQNSERDATDVFAHLVEVIGGVSPLASDKMKPGVEPSEHLAKSVAWWMSLCGKLGVRSAEALIWDKFPGVCAYCARTPHHPDACADVKSANLGPPWQTLEELGSGAMRPDRLGGWQRMFSDIYPAQQTEDYGTSFARLAEELGELAEAVRVFSSRPGYFLSEAADVFAWLMHVQNITDSKSHATGLDRGAALERTFARMYPDVCKDCRNAVCACPQILVSTVGRIAHEVPTVREGGDEHGRFMTVEEAATAFREI
jgi:pyrimidine deaminase RibD-like protein/NTP pyrophosphatase (non-canonical NTP hydrolase)